MGNEFASLWHSVVADMDRPDFMWQAGVLALCLLLAKLADHFVRGRDVREGRFWQIGHGGLKRVVFPLVALFLAMILRALLKSSIHVNLLSLAIPLLGSLAIIQVVFYVLGHSFGGAKWLRSFERVFALMVWSIVVLHVTGLLPELVDAMDAVTFQVGKSKLSLWLVLQGSVTVFATVLIALWMGNAVESQLNRAVDMDQNLRIVLVRFSKACLVLLAVLIGLPLVGIDLTTLSVFGGALGVGIGFGLQKTASNYISGFILLLDRSIRIGNIISVGTDRGVVTRITTRYTVLRNYAGIEALVPNELLVASVVKNESYSDPLVRVAMRVQVSYDSDVERAIELLKAAARVEPRVVSAPSPDVLLYEFGDSGIGLELGVWIADPGEGTGNLRSKINLAIWHSFKANGIVIPYPQREVRVVNAAAPTTGSGEKRV